MFHIMKYVDNVNWADSINPSLKPVFNHYSVTPQNLYKLCQLQVHKEKGQGSCINWATNLWNSLPNTIVSLQMLQTFKSALVEIEFYEEQFLQYS